MTREDGTNAPAPEGGRLPRLERLLADSLHVEVPSPDTDLLESGLLDSLGLVELLVSLEEAFAVQIPLDALDIDDFRTLRRIEAALERLGAGDAGRDGSAPPSGAPAADGVEVRVA